MSAGAVRRARQAEIEAEFFEDQNERPNISIPPTPGANRCGAALGRPHDYSMRGNDGIYRCWTCCQRKPVTS